MNKISVIIPIYNNVNYIKEAVNSVLNQLHKNIELLLIDDGNEKTIKDMLEKIKKSDDRIKLISSKTNKGVAYARNLGIEHAIGDYIYFMDSDDYIPKETLQLFLTHTNSEVNIGSVKKTYMSNSFTVTYDGYFSAKTYTDKKYNLLNRKSIVNILFSSEFIKNNNLLFSDSYISYSDLDFLIRAFKSSKVVSYLKEAIYFKRLHDENITNPTLMNEDKTRNVIEAYQIYRTNKISLKPDEIETDGLGLDNFILNYYRRNTINYLKKNGNLSDIYHTILDSLKLLNHDVINELDYILKKEVKTLISENKRKYFKMMSRHNFIREIKNAKTNRKKLIFIYQNIFNKLPVNNKLVFFESFIGRNYSDSPKYIYEYLLENYPEYKFVWSLNDPTKDIPGNAIKVKRFSLEYFYYLSRSKYWISNSRLPKYLNKKKEAIFLQTWHGTPLKKLVFDMDGIFSADPLYKENFYFQSSRWDYLSSPNQYSTDIFRRAFKYDGPMLEYGYPRNDILYQKNNEKDINILKDKLKIPNNKKVILYAPTWRDDDYISRGNYNFKLQLDLKKLQKELGREYVVLLRMHYFISNEIDLSDYEGFAYNFSDFDDIAELYLVSDLLITDYSSVFFDYANLKKPILFYMYDIDKYQNQLRGFYIDVNNELPGDILKTTDDVIDTIVNLKKYNEKHKKKYEEFYLTYCNWDDGEATKNTVEKLFDK